MRGGGRRGLLNVDDGDGGLISVSGYCGGSVVLKGAGDDGSADDGCSWWSSGGSVFGRRWGVGVLAGVAVLVSDVANAAAAFVLGLASSGSAASSRSSAHAA